MDSKTRNRENLKKVFGSCTFNNKPILQIMEEIKEGYND